MVTSAAVPDVVAKAMMGKLLCLVSAVPSSDLTSANSGFSVMMPIAFAVSMTEPPPMAMMTSAFAFSNAAKPFLTLAMVGFALTSSNIS